MEERGVLVEHSSINRWAICSLPLVEKMARKHKRPVDGSLRMDETYIEVKASGNIAIAPSTGKEILSPFCSRPSATWLRRSASLTRPWEQTANPTRSRWTRTSLTGGHRYDQPRRDVPIVVRHVKYFINTAE